MLVDGIFYLTFQSFLGILGSGLAVIENGQIRGGDDHYLYSGWYRLLDRSQDFIAQVDVQHYKGDQYSIFGTLTFFQLELKGSFTEKGLCAKGNIEGEPEFTITLEGVRIEEFYSSLFSDKVITLDEEDESLLKDPFNLLNQANRNSFLTAEKLHLSGKYLDALKIMFPIIEATINALLKEVGEVPERFNGLARKAEALGKRNVIPLHIVYATDIVYARNKILHGNYCPPDSYLYPISLLAFQHLHSLLTECNINLP